MHIKLPVSCSALLLIASLATAEPVVFFDDFDRQYRGTVGLYSGFGEAVADYFELTAERPAGGALFESDDFDRPEPGDDWIPVFGTWGILNGSMSLTEPEGPVNVISYEPAEYDLTQPFRVEADIVAPEEGFSGIAFHVVDADNLFALRARSTDGAVQFYRMRDGEEGVEGGISETLPFFLQPGNSYRFAVQMTGPRSYFLSISDGVQTWSTSAFASINRSPGPDWTAAAGFWSIDDFARLRGDPQTTSNQVIYYNGQQLTGSWELEARFHHTSLDDHWQGFVFNFQEDDGVSRAYLYRLRSRHGANASHQLLEVQWDGSGISFPANMSDSIGGTETVMTVNTVYRLKLSWDAGAPEQIEISFFEGETLLFNRTGDLGAARDLTGAGFAGIYDSRSMATHDFRLAVEPADDLSGFAAWQALHFSGEELQDENISGKLANPAGDGLSNFLKYAFGLDPKQSVRDALPVPEALDGHLTLQYPRLKDAPDVIYEPQVSSGLESWDAGPAFVEEVDVEDAGDFDIVTIRDLTPMSENSRRFLRVAVSETDE